MGAPSQYSSKGTRLVYSPMTQESSFQGPEPMGCMAETLIDNASPIPLLEISKIKEITERALRSEDPINLYKARALDDIAEILGIEIKEPEIAKRLVIKQDEDLSNPMMTAYRGYITFYEEG